MVYVWGGSNLGNVRAPKESGKEDTRTGAWTLPRDLFRISLRPVQSFSSASTTAPVLVKALAKNPPRRQNYSLHQAILDGKKKQFKKELGVVCLFIFHISIFCSFSSPTISILWTLIFCIGYFFKGVSFLKRKKRKKTTKHNTILCGYF